MYDNTFIVTLQITKALVQVYEDPYTCYNNVIDDKETDIDCGGICTSTCLYGQSCLVDGDCATNHCRNHICEDVTSMLFDLSFYIHSSGYHL